MNPKAPTGLMPADSASGATLHTIVAVMSFLACLALGGVLTLSRMASQWTDGLSSSATVQLLPSSQISPDDQVKEALSVVSQWPGIMSAKALSRGEANALLEPWLGKGNVLDDLPAPQLIEVTRDKKVVWTFRDFKLFGDATPVAIVLDDQGQPLK